MKYVLWILATLAFTGLVLFGYIKYNSSKDDTKTTNQSQSSNSSNDANSGTTLDISNQGITKLDPSVYGKTTTTQLILSNNSLSTLPSEMGKMTNLTILKLDHNLLEGSLIGEIRQVTQLRVLDASYNNMTGVPAEIGQLSKLESLNLSNNKITALPNEIKNLQNNLKLLDLTGNDLSGEQVANLRLALPTTTVIF